MSEARAAKIFRLDGDQILEIPEDWEFSGDEVEVLKDEDRLIIRPAQERLSEHVPVAGPRPS